MVKTATASCGPSLVTTARLCKTAGVRYNATLHSVRCRWLTMLPESRRTLVLSRAEDGPLGSNKLGETVEDQYDFDEGAAQVQRLLERDRKELMGIEDIGASFRTEFDEEEEEDESKEQQNGAPSSSGRSAATSPFTAGSTKAASPFSKPSAAANPFSVRASSSPFGGGASPKPYKEMEDMSPYMEPDSLDDQPWWKSISLGQVLIVLSFTLIISLMLGTFTLVLKVGGIHFNE